MRTILLTIFFSIGSYPLFSQYQTGHTTITFNDPSRTGGFGSGGGPGRQIQTEIYYPAATAGEDVTPSTGSFPVIVFGHGFVMAWDAYENIWSYLSENGYIVAFPRTEGNFSPDHEEFALDLKLVADKIIDLNTNASSLFFGHVDNKAGIAGHSMGGGATILAASGNTNIQAILGLAPAETNPSAISAATSVTVPALLFSGSADGVTPPNDHHIPIYSGLASSCKYFISITGGAHCYFANSNLNCDLGELTSSTGISISRADQQDIMNDYILDWFDYTLKSDATAQSTFESNLISDSRISYENDCNQLPTGISELETAVKIYPNPANDIVTVEASEEISALRLIDITGKTLMTMNFTKVRKVQFQVQDLPVGYYLLQTMNASGIYTNQKLVINK